MGINGGKAVIIMLRFYTKKPDRRENVLMKAKMRFMCAVLCVLMLVCLLPTTARAAEEVTASTYDDLWRGFYATEDNTITLDRDIIYSVPEGGNQPLLPYQFLMDVNGTESKTLDLNGHTLQVSNEQSAWPIQSALFTLYGTANLTVMNGTIMLSNYNNTARTDGGVFSVNDDAYLTLMNVDIVTTGDGTVVNAQNNATLTIEGGTITARNGFAVTARGTAWVILDKDVTLTTHDGGSMITQFGNAGYGSLHSSTPNLTVISALFKAGIEVAESTISQFTPSSSRLVFVENTQYQSAFPTTKSGKYYWDTAATGGCALTVNDTIYRFAPNVHIISATAKQRITVTNGTASHTQATYGTTVTVTAKNISGKVFDRWHVESGDVYLEDSYAETTTFTMGAKPVAIRAGYKNAPIAAVEVAVPNPVQGGHPATATSNTSNITVEETWYAELHENGSFSSQLPENHTFEGGHTYRLSVKLVMATGYTLDDDATVQFKDPVTGTKKTAAVGATRYIWFADFTVKDETVVLGTISATVSGVTAGTKPGATTVTAADSGYTVSILNWYDCDNVFGFSSSNKMKSTDTFTGGKTYTVAVKFTPEGFHTFDSGTVAFINGENGMIGSWDGKSRIYYITVTVPVPQGWVKENGRWYFYENGARVKEQWRENTGGWCYLGYHGYMLTDKWVQDSHGWRYAGADGYMLTNTWCKDSVGWCYVGADGYCVTNCWQQDSIGWCYLNAQGRMVTNGWVLDGGKWYYLDGNGYMVANQWRKDSKGWCWLTASGAMATNQWVKDSKGWCYVGADGYCWTNRWAKDSIGWIWLDSEGSMTKNAWVLDGGSWYYLDAEGYMLANTSRYIGGKTYNFNASGVCTNP